MKKLMITAAVLAAGSLWADLQYLYWQVAPTEGAPAFAYASLAYGAGDSDTATGYLTIGDTACNKLARDAAAVYSPLGSEPNAYSYWVELYTYENSVSTLVGVSETKVSYGELHEAGAIYGNMNTTGNTPYRFTNFMTVPEPTSLGLLLLGVAGLALRRKGGQKPATSTRI